MDSKLEQAYARIDELENIGSQNNMLTISETFFEDIMSRVCPLYKSEIPLIESITIEYLNIPFVVLIIDDAFQGIVLKKAQELVQRIPSDVWNWPLTNIATSSHSSSFHEVLANLFKLQYNPQQKVQWRREKYRTFVRFAPINLQDYIHSPIKDIVAAATFKAKQFALAIGIEDSLFLDTCVMQEITTHTKCAVHQDIGAMSKNRVVAFMYYIQIEENCGGELCFHRDRNSDPYEKVKVRSNRFILMDIRTNPWHSISDYQSHISRIAIVGFLSKR